MEGKERMGIADLAAIVGSVGFGLFLVVAMQRAGRQQAGEIRCISNLRQWADVFQGYVQRNDGNFISGHAWYWIERLDAEHKDRERTTIWFCPRADKPLFDEQRTRVRESATFSAWGVLSGEAYGPAGMAGSYGLNGHALDAPPGYRFERDIDTTFSWRTPNVKGAATIPLFIDALRFDLWPRATDEPPKQREHEWGPNHMARCCIDRHKGAVNCLFMDWSVRRVGLKQLWTLKWHRGFDTAGPWTKAGGVQPADWPQWMRGLPGD